MTILIFLSFLLNFSFAQSPENELTFHVIKSPLGLNWESPMSVLMSIQKNRLILTKRPLGSVFTELNCGGEKTLQTTTYETLDLFNLLILNQDGLGVFFHSFPGKLEKGETLRDELAGYFTEGRVNFITFALTSEQCERARNYLQEYESKNVAQNWGLTNIPRKAEGGNAGAFAASVLEVLGFDEEIFKEGWIRSRRVPRDLVGRPRENKRVSVLKILGSQWARKQEPYYLLNFWDPELIHEWIQRNLSNFPRTEKAQTPGISLDRRNFPLMSTPYWLPQENLEPKG